MADSVALIIVTLIIAKTFKLRYYKRPNDTLNLKFDPRK